MTRPTKPVTILMAEDDEEDRLLTAKAFRESRLLNPLVFVTDGEELMDYLFRRGAFAPPASAPAPGLVLLDLNMPRKDGREALREIKSDPALRRIPVIVMTSSEAEEDVVRSYDLGVNSFICKPVRFEKLLDTVRTLGKYWLEIVELPEPAA